MLVPLLMAVTNARDAPDPGAGLISCLHDRGLKNITTMSSSSTSEYDVLLNFSLQNLRFAEPGVRKPYVIVIPQSKEQVKNSVVCCVKNRWEIRVRSGGHSYEGLSYTSDVPFVLIDLMNFDNVHVDIKSMTAWVEAGATLGQVYSGIANKTNNNGFPAGTCPTIGSGGHFAGGGLGFLSRKYGLAADNVIDALLVNASGEIMDKKAMGDDVFWALRGGGGGSWGVVIAWKIKLVRVPTILTAFEVSRTGRDVVTDIIHRWQYIWPFVEEDLFMRVQFFGITVEGGTKKDMNASFQGMYLGRKEQFLKIVNIIFPELKMAEDECSEMSWIESTSFIGGTTNVSELTDRYLSNKFYFKMKSDMVRTPLPKSVIQGLCDILEEVVNGFAIFSPLGGIMDRIPSSALPFPHRAGNIFDIQYVSVWNNRSDDERYLNWMRKLYAYMAPYVSSSPRAAYVNYLDLDLGSAVNGTSTVKEAETWGKRYFLDNFDRLVKAKTEVDPHNFFRNSQSIPPRSN